MARWASAREIVSTRPSRTDALVIRFVPVGGDEVDADDVRPRRVCHFHPHVQDPIHHGPNTVNRRPVRFRSVAADHQEILRVGSVEASAGRVRADPFESEESIGVYFFDVNAWLKEAFKAKVGLFLSALRPAHAVPLVNGPQFAVDRALNVKRDRGHRARVRPKSDAVDALGRCGTRLGAFAEADVFVI